MLRIKNYTSTSIFVFTALVSTALISACSPINLTVKKVVAGATSVTNTVTPSVNIEIPIEMIDKGVQADGATNLVWALSTTTLNTAAYDGSPRYFFEIVADNSADADLADETVNLRDSTNAIKASITVPAASFTTRLRVEFTPNTGTDTYKLNTPGTGNYKVYAARIIIQQTNATKTKIYIPLSSAAYSNASTDTVAAVFSRSNAAYASDNDKLPVWLKEESAFATLASTSPWTFEAVISAHTCTGHATLFNASTGNQVTESEVTHNTTTPTIKSASFSNSASNFTDGSHFEVRLKTTGICGDGNGVKLFKAGLWVTLENGISKAQSYYRLGRSYAAGGSYSFTNENQRVLINTSLFSSPTIYHEIASYEGAADSTVTESIIQTVGANDTGTGGASGITLSDVKVSSTSKSRARSSALSITSGDRFIVNSTCDDSSSCSWIHNLIIVRSSAN